MDWIGTVVRFVTGVLSTIFTERFSRWLDRPHVQISFAPDEHCLRESNVHLKTEHRIWEEEAKFLRFKVANRRGAAARGCRAFIVELARKADDGSWTILLLDPLPLKCAYIGFDPIEIPKGAHFYFDVMSARQHQTFFSLEAKAKPLLLEGATGEKSQYRFGIAVTGENFDPLALRIVCDWKQDWNFVDVWKEEEKG